MADGGLEIGEAFEGVAAAEVEEMKRFVLFVIFNAEAQRRRVRREDS